MNEMKILSQKKRILMIALPICIVGLLGLLLVNLAEFTRKAKASEAKADLASIVTAERTFYEGRKVYSDDFEQLGYFPTGNMRYTVFIQPFCEPPMPPKNYVGPSSHLPLAELAARIDKAKRKIEKLNLPCKDPQVGFRALAVSEDGDDVEVWAMDESLQVQRIPL